MLSRCSYTRVKLQHINSFHRIDGHFADCDFFKSKGEGAVFNALFERCDFTDCNFKRAILGGNFVACTFRNTNFLRASWGSSCFEHCTFENCKIDDRDVDFAFNEQPTESMIVNVMAHGGIQLGQRVKFYS